jgi:hypothetical protein
MCLRRAPEKYIAGAALDRAAVEYIEVSLCRKSNLDCLFVQPVT